MENIKFTDFCLEFYCKCANGQSVSPGGCMQF